MHKMFQQKNGQFYSKKISLRAKKPQKTGVFGVFRSALKHFANLLYDPDDAQTHRIATRIDAQGVAKIKEAPFKRKKIEFWAKNRQKIGFFGVYSSTLRRFGISLYDSDDAQTHRIAT